MAATQRLISLAPCSQARCVHLTSVRELEGIRNKGYITPNRGGFPDTYPQSAQSFGRKYGYVSLFDFETPTEVQILLEYHKWVGFFYRHEPVTVLISFNRQGLEPKLLPNATAKERVGYEIPWMPRTEVWYPEPLALSWATSRILVYPTEPIQYKVFKLNSDSYKSEIEEVLATI